MDKKKQVDDNSKIVKLGKPVKEVPELVGRKWAFLWEVVEKLKDGEWQPVVCPNRDYAKAVQIMALTHRKTQLQSAVRGLTVYVRKVQ